ncbi:MAG: DoxX family membrane protein [Bdellovibrionales bacterium]|nr:DoxX family membrane protein [Bdellovibrionales bacterium]
MPMIARILLGLIFFVFGLMGLLNLAPPPPNMPEKLAAFMTGIMATGYFFPLLKSTEVVCGALLLANRFVALALVVLAPIIINIVGVNVFLQPSGLPLALVIVALEAYLAFFSPYKGPIQALFKAKPAA